MTAAWQSRLPQILAQIDLSKLLPQILARSQELPPQIAHDLKQLLVTVQSANAEVFHDEERRASLVRTTSQFLTVLALVLLTANVMAPDAVFAKGSGYAGGSGDDGDLGWGFFGMMMTTGGFVWLVNLLEASNGQE
jgi:spermidine synthase